MNRTSIANRRTRLVPALLLVVMLLLPTVPALAEDNATYTIKFSGVIDVVPAAAGDPWQVAGYILTVGDVTRVRPTNETPAAGMWADVTARRLADNSLLALVVVVKPPEVRLKGPLAAKPNDGIGAWTIAGRTIWFTTESVISQRSGPVEVGQWVEAFAVEKPAGTLTSVRVRGIEAAEDAEIYGAIQSFGGAQWVLSSIPVAATTDTLILGEPESGLLAQAAAELTPAGLSARVFRVAWQEPTRRRQPIQLTGLIDALPNDSLLGLWQVAGQSVEVLPSTQIFQVKGLVQLGARVHIVGWQVADHLVATQITVLASPSGSGRQFYLHGAIEALPEQGLLGTWTIDGQQVQVTRQTRIHGQEQVHLGAPVEAAGLQFRDGVRLTTWLRVRDMSGPGPQPTVTPGGSRTPGGTPQATGTPGNGPQPTHTPQPSRTPGSGPGPTRSLASP